MPSHTHATSHNITASAYFGDILLGVYFACLNQRLRITSSLLHIHHDILEDLGDLGEDGVCKSTAREIHGSQYN
jgi:hypothetical protein